MLLFACKSCPTQFGVHVVRALKTHERRSKSKADARPLKETLCCPVCRSEKIEEIDPVEKIGSHVAKRLIDWWKTLPSGD